MSACTARVSFSTFPSSSNDSSEAAVTDLMAASNSLKIQRPQDLKPGMDRFSDVPEKGAKIFDQQRKPFF